MILKKKTPMSPAMKIARLLFVAADAADVELEPSLCLTPSPGLRKIFQAQYSWAKFKMGLT